MGFSTNTKLYQKLKEVFSFLDNLTQNRLLKWSNTSSIENSSITDGAIITLNKQITSTQSLFSRGVKTTSFSSNTATLDVDYSETFNHFIVPTPSYEFHKTVDNSTFANSKFPSIKEYDLIGANNIYTITNLRRGIIIPSEWDITNTIPKKGLYEVSLYISDGVNKKILFTFDYIVTNSSGYGVPSLTYLIHSYNSLNGDIINYQEPDLLTFKNYRFPSESTSPNRKFFLSSKLITSLENV